MKTELVYYRMWDKRTHAIRIEKAEFNFRVGIEMKYDLLSIINIEANNKDFLQELDTIMSKGAKYCEMWLSGLMSDYVKRSSKSNNDSPYLLEYYTDWLDNTIFIINGKYPLIEKWCNNYKTWIFKYYENTADSTDTDTGMAQYSKELLSLFHNNTNLIEELIGKSDDDIAKQINKWANEKDKFGKPLIENPRNNLKQKFANGLKAAGIIKQAARTFRNKL